MSPELAESAVALWSAEARKEKDRADSLAACVGALRREIDEWRKVCRALAPEINSPDDVDGWLVNVNDVADAMPPDIKAGGCGQSPMEFIGHLADSRDELLRHLVVLAAEDSQCAPDWVAKKKAARDAAALILRNETEVRR